MAANLQYVSFQRAHMMKCNLQPELARLTAMDLQTELAVQHMHAKPDYINSCATADASMDT